MTFELILFYVFSTVVAGSALAVISVKNTVHAALFLVLAFFSSACVWLLLRAEFLAITLVLVYVGAVMVLFLFVVMMLDVENEKLRDRIKHHVPVAALVSVIMLIEMLAMIGWRNAFTQVSPIQDAASVMEISNIEWVGRALYKDYILPFEVAAVILTVAIIAAITLTLRRRVGIKIQNPANQVAVRKEDRLRVIRMQSTRDEKTP